MWRSEDDEKRALTAQTDAAGIPREATVIEQIPPAVPDITLQDRHRPIPAGVTIEREDTGGDCTINVNANTQEMGPGLITSSHCTIRFGNEGDGTRFHQNVISNFVAVEFADPPIIACFWPDGCRFSDAAFAGYASTSLPFHGTIARTTGPGNPGDLTVNPNTPRFFLNDPNDPPLNDPAVGTVVNKIGRTTGWTQGQVTQTCVDVEWTVPSEGVSVTYYLRCQTLASYASEGGDSGAPVFTWDGFGNYVDLRGIHAGRYGPDRNQRVFSLWKYVDLELNSIVGFIDVAYHPL